MRHIICKALIDERNTGHDYNVGGRPQLLITPDRAGSRGSGFWTGKKQKKLNVTANHDPVDRVPANELTEEETTPPALVLRRAEAVGGGIGGFGLPAYNSGKQQKPHGNLTHVRTQKTSLVFVPSKSTKAEELDRSSYLRPFEWFRRSLSRSFKDFVDLDTKKKADELLVDGSVTSYGLSDPGSYTKFIKRGNTLIFHQYVQHPETGRELLKRLYDNDLRVPYAVTEIATSAMWDDSWEHEPDLIYDKVEDATVARSMQYAIVFHPDSKSQAGALANFLDTNAKRPKEGPDTSVPYSWVVPDMRASFKKQIGGYLTRLLNTKVVGTKELMALTANAKLDGFKTLKVQINPELARLVKSHVRGYVRGGAPVVPYSRGYHRQAQGQLERIIDLLQNRVVPKTSKARLERYTRYLHNGRPLTPKQREELERIEARLWNKTTVDATVTVTKAIFTKKRDASGTPTKSRKPGKPAKASEKGTNSKTGKRTYKYPAAKMGKTPQQPLPHLPPIDIQALASRLRTTTGALREYAAQYKNADHFARHFSIKLPKLMKKHGITEHKLKQLHETLVPPSPSAV